MQPTKPLILVRGGPQRFVTGPQPPNAPLFSPDLRFGLERRFHFNGTGPDFQVGSFTLQESATLTRDGSEEFVERVGKLLNALLDQLLCDVIQRDAVSLQLGKDRASAF